ncbi:MULTISPECIES: DUF2062 domain-containing protein [Gammaproteobacteria]|uniref:DUF2062 domain-containing protein n=1 Tax=Gammaproteobacteria TaxID=1236 RepID=UPI000DD096F3|nr:MULTISPECIES: DUF2062 domain-containing protein [Gammaproteobacteria]RTE86943.1 DUF2062 domain-containing protein [Aliidiomarina sp. B3213]TCZ93267.1 DUF2062 domain-containing protein [Lysobacter sp. N42]
MPKKFIQGLIPDPRKLQSVKSLRILGSWVHNPNYWHLNRRSASGAFAIGLFVAFLPFPLHMLIAAALAVMTRVNVPLSVALVWITNPLTITPFVYASYKVGTFLLQQPGQSFQFEMSIAWFTSGILNILPALMLGSIVIGSLAGLTGYIVVRSMWRHAVRSAWNARREARRLRTEG